MPSDPVTYRHDSAILRFDRDGARIVDVRGSWQGVCIPWADIKRHYADLHGRDSQPHRPDTDPKEPVVKVGVTPRTEYQARHPGGPLMSVNIDLDRIRLDRGPHASPEDGACAMEWVSILAGEPFTDHPACTSPVIAEFVRAWNDHLNDGDRQRLLRPLLPELVGTATGPEDDQVRGWMATDWLVRVHAPAWLRAAGLDAQADLLAGMSPVTADTVPQAQWLLGAVQQDAAAAGDAAGAAARTAARAAARAAARDAAGAAASAAAGAAARAAVRPAAGDVWNPAWAAARAARDVARDAAWAAAEDMRRPTVETLQTSAQQLIRDMCAVGR